MIFGLGCLAFEKIAQAIESEENGAVLSENGRKLLEACDGGKSTAQLFHSGFPRTAHVSLIQAYK
jgi:hypothetical protein